MPLPMAAARARVAVFAALRAGWLEQSARERLARRLAFAGDLGGALAVHREAVGRALPRAGTRLAEAATLYGGTLLYGGWYGEAQPFLEAAEAMTAGWPPGRLRDQAVRLAAAAAGARGDHDRALAMLAAADLPERRADAAWQAWLLATRAGVELAAGRPVAAVADLEAARAAAAHGDREQRVVIANNLAGALVDAGRLEDAAAVLAGAKAGPAPTPGLAAHLAGTRAELELARGDLAAAGEALDRSARQKEAIGMGGGRGWTLAMRARLAAAAGDEAAAGRLLEEARPLLQTVDAARTWAEAAAAIGLDRSLPAPALPAPDPLAAAVVAAARPLPPSAPRRLEYGVAAAGLLLGASLLWLLGRVL